MQYQAMSTLSTHPYATWNKLSNKPQPRLKALADGEVLLLVYLVEQSLFDSMPSDSREVCDGIAGTEVGSDDNIT